MQEDMGNKRLQPPEAKEMLVRCIIQGQEVTPSLEAACPSYRQSQRLCWWSLLGPDVAQGQLATAACWRS